MEFPAPNADILSQQVADWKAHKLSCITYARSAELSEAQSMAYPSSSALDDDSQAFKVEFRLPLAFAARSALRLGKSNALNRAEHVILVQREYTDQPKLGLWQKFRIIDAEVMEVKKALEMFPPVVCAALERARERVRRNDRPDVGFISDELDKDRLSCLVMMQTTIPSRDDATGIEGEQRSNLSSVRATTHVLARRSLLLPLTHKVNKLEVHTSEDLSVLCPHHLVSLNPRWKDMLCEANEEDAEDALAMGLLDFDMSEGSKRLKMMMDLIDSGKRELYRCVDAFCSPGSC